MIIHFHSKSKTFELLELPATKTTKQNKNATHTYLAKKERATNMKTSKLPFNSQESEFRSATHPSAHIKIKDEINKSKNYNKRKENVLHYNMVWGNKMKNLTQPC